MREISEEKKKEIRESDEYKKTQKLLKLLYERIKRAKAFQTYEFDHFSEMCIGFKERWKEANEVPRIFIDLKTGRRRSPKHQSMGKMLSYLGLVESLGVAFADAILIMLIANGRAVHTTRGLTKHVTKVKELEKIDLAYKLEFLEDEGLEIFKILINRDTRNHVAHLKFTIQGNGEIRKRDKEKSPIHIDEDIRNFWSGVDVLRVVFEDIGLLSWFTGENQVEEEE